MRLNMRNPLSGETKRGSQIRQRSGLIDGRLDQDGLTVDKHQDVASERDASLATFSRELGGKITERFRAERDDSRGRGIGCVRHEPAIDPAISSLVKGE